MDACEPVGVTEIAERLGLKAQTVSQLRWQRKLPAADWVVSGRPAWNWSTIEAWAKATGRL